MEKKIMIRSINHSVFFHFLDYEFLKNLCRLRILTQSEIYLTRGQDGNWHFY